jgi:DNA-binding transcriptional LysR family regulator
LPVWLAKHPDVRIDLLLADGLNQLVEEQVDVAIRLGTLPDSTLVARPIATSHAIIVASAAYLAARGEPRTPDHLAQHDCLLFSGKRQPDWWQLEGSAGEVRCKVDGRLTLSTVDALYEAVLADLGLAITPAWLWADELRRGVVRQVLPDYAPPSQPIHALTTTKPAPGSKARAFLDFLVGIESATSLPMQVAASRAISPRRR